MTKKKLKITFKKEPRETGLAGVANPYPATKIKESGKVIGYIHPPTWKTEDDKWLVRIAVKKGDDEPRENSDWKWVKLTHRYETEPEARKVVKENLQRVMNNNKLQLHHFED